MHVSSSVFIVCSLQIKHSITRSVSLPSNLRPRLLYEPNAGAEWLQTECWERKWFGECQRKTKNVRRVLPIRRVWIRSRHSGLLKTFVLNDDWGLRAPPIPMCFNQIKSLLLSSHLWCPIQTVRFPQVGTCMFLFSFIKCSSTMMPQGGMVTLENEVIDSLRESGL